MKCQASALGFFEWLKWARGTLWSMCHSPWLLQDMPGKNWPETCARASATGAPSDSAVEVRFEPLALVRPSVR